jgi:Leu/Phe-tRNA-protein transferase
MKKLYPQDLKIGNYVYYNGFKIKLDGSLFAQYLQNELANGIYPIKLDTVFLDNTKLVKQESRYCFSEYSAFELERSQNGNWHVTYMGVYLGKQIEYIHELQNFYYEIFNKML